MAITTSSSLPAPVQENFDYKLLSVPTPNFIHGLAAMPKEMDANSGTTLRMRRYDPLKSATVPLGNSGITPPAQTLSAVDIDAKIDFYGSYVYLNEQVTLQNQDPVLNEAVKRLGVSMRQTEDELIRNMLSSTASSINCVNGTNGDNPTELTREDIDEVIKSLADANAYTISDMVEGEDKYGTAPIRDAYFAMGSTKLIGDLEAVNGFVSKNQYPDQRNVLRPEWGSVSNLRFLLSSIGSVSESASAISSNNVYNIFVAGMEAYAVVEQNNYSSQFIYRPPIYDSPVALNASVGYKFAQVPRITNDAWVINLRTTLNV